MLSSTVESVLKFIRHNYRKHCHLGTSFPPSLRRQILHIAFAMRPICLLDRAKNLYQSDRLHFISDSYKQSSRVLLFLFQS